MLRASGRCWWLDFGSETRLRVLCGLCIERRVRSGSNLLLLLQDLLSVRGGLIGITVSSHSFLLAKPTSCTALAMRYSCVLETGHGNETGGQRRHGLTLLCMRMSRGGW